MYKWYTKGILNDLALQLASFPLRMLLMTAGFAASFLPRPVELWIGAGFGRLVLALGGFRWRIAAENMRRCFPKLSATDQKRLLRMNFEHYGILFFEFLHFFSPIPGHYRRYAERNSKLHGYENWKKASDKGRGVVFFSSHMGFWEMIAAAGGIAGFSPLIVTTRLKPTWLHRLITECRESTEVRAALHPGSGMTVLRALRKGESIAFMNDQYAPPPMGVPVPFFGMKADTLAAIAPLVRRTSAAIIPVSSYRDERGVGHVMLEPELDLGRAIESTEESTAILASKVEGWIRERPEQWLWIHRRFKNVPAEAA